MAKYVGFKTGKIHEEYTYSDHYCGGCGYPVTDHDSYCPECGGAFRKCDSNEHDMCKLLTWIREHPWVNVSFSQPFDDLSIVITVDYCGLSITESISMKSFCNEDELIDFLNNLYHKILTDEIYRTELIKLIEL